VVDIDSWKFKHGNPINIATGVHDMKGQSWRFEPAGPQTNMIEGLPMQQGYPM